MPKRGVAPPPAQNYLSAAYERFLSASIALDGVRNGVVG